MVRSKISANLKPFTKEEDEVILQEIAKIQQKDRYKTSPTSETKQMTVVWRHIASKLPNRDLNQVRDRYTACLDPNSMRPWTIAEKNILLSMQREIGNQWSVIAKSLPGRTRFAVKNYWYSLQTSFQRYRKRMEKNRTKRPKTGDTWHSAQWIASNDRDNSAPGGEMSARVQLVDDAVVLNSSM
jgi:hypothetical protein